MTETSLFRGRVLRWILTASLPCACVIGLQAALLDEPAREKEIVGAVEGDSIALEGPMTANVVNGQVKRLIRAAAGFRVSPGRPTIELVKAAKSPFAALHTFPF